MNGIEAKIKNLPGMTPSEVELFWNQASVIGTDDCWIWKGSLSPTGYGRFFLPGNREVYLSHRIAWYLSNHRQPGLMLVCHRCDNPSCVNPNHLFLGNASDNTQDMLSKNRGVNNSGENHGLSKLTNHDVERIKQFRTMGYSQQWIANEFKVVQSTISRILSGHRWKHL